MSVDTEITWKRVQSALRKGGGTIPDLAKRTGLHGTVIKQGLDMLHDAQLVKCVDDIWWLLK